MTTPRRSSSEQSDESVEPESSMCMGKKIWLAIIGTLVFVCGLFGLLWALGVFGGRKSTGRPEVSLVGLVEAHGLAPVWLEIDIGSLLTEVEQASHDSADSPRSDSKWKIDYSSQVQIVGEQGAVGNSSWVVVQRTPAMIIRK